jgi:hypothetical protein
MDFRPTLIQDALYRLDTGWKTEGPEFESQLCQEFFILHIIQTGTGAHPISYLIGTGSVSPGVSGRGVKVTTHLQLVRRSIKL